MKEVVIVGGGLAGLMTAHALARKKVHSVLIERKAYPFHRVCGEYISEEVTPYLESFHLFPHHLHPPHIKTLHITSVNGRRAILPLDLGGFGVSRFEFDRYLFEKLPRKWVEVHQNTEVSNVHFTGNSFTVNAGQHQIQADVVIGSFGKRSRLDATMERTFMKKRSPYAGVKYHVRTSHSSDVIALHNFKDGYCGLSNIENGKSNLCYLTHRDNLRNFGSVPEMERQILFKNPFLKRIFESAEFLFDRPEVINEISFEVKAPIENHLLMCGDAAGMITPLCGNGMAMAIHSSKLVSEVVADFCVGKITRDQMENQYRYQWASHFTKRLWAGRKIQSLFGSEFASNMAVNIARYAKPVAKLLISKTHGVPF